MNSQTQVGLTKPPSLLSLRENEIKHLVHYSEDRARGEILVWIDKKIDLDWECDDQHGAFVESQVFEVSIRGVETRVALYEPSFHNWPSDLKLAAKRLLGEAIYSAQIGDFKGADFLLGEAVKFRKEKGPQVARYWTLWACLIASGILALAGLIECFLRVRLSNWMGMGPFLLSLCFCAGGLGAGFFVMMNLGKRPRVDASAERHLHWIEGAARILGGGLGGLLVGGLVRLGVILPAFLRPGMEPLAMCMAAMIAGVSERLAVGIVTKIEGQATVPHAATLTSQEES